MTVSQSLWQSNEDLAQACLKHPFVMGIADGTLPEAQFAYYIGQDTFFLAAFVRAYSIAAAKSPDWDGFRAFHKLANGVLAELTLHTEYAARWHVDIHAVEPGSATRRYTDFLLATAWGSDVGLIVAAMSPCMRLYAFIGQQLSQRQTSDHLYTEWIRTYSDPAFVALSQQIERLTDTYAVDAPQTPAIYRYAMQCEYDFFQTPLEQGVSTKTVPAK
ncbi:MAG: TenA family transcriptional regulator [Chloroflexi bacterium AL-W]|nr:TenA family transcriptional regulator [Chloroflexi bacterium AL-N1]NOK71675.1 TenA family transcriptional regulator [Chloroflexi bacterium AL-N10]NOK79016.1 TenA family transcriptional regulator [Chloroflexi bacterium AL-N5]NOK86450.1 TenA family transcriptional regulator [Chloroflexi bacterium AL-W]NOK93416.1 TenA family transcriptional regulator [Chloroflexi bacterium AL-N15]